QYLNVHNEVIIYGVSCFPLSALLPGLDPWPGPAHAVGLFAAQLAATKAGRHTLREEGAYLVLRELHRWEREPEVLSACEKLIQVLIGDEPGPGMENLLEVSVPEEVEQQLQRLDREEEERWRREQAEAQGSRACPEELPP
uniref:Protein HGH1 C-terminal domain-containing protein n=1 Tax=Dromaius novaehollandiae TaxID=8790 RepID=A0A8C4KMG9_DRONO